LYGAVAGVVGALANVVPLVEKIANPLYHGAAIIGIGAVAGGLAKLVTELGRKSGETAPK
jgi:hypothetical protein